MTLLSQEMKDKLASIAATTPDAGAVTTVIADTAATTTVAAPIVNDTTVVSIAAASTDAPDAAPAPKQLTVGDTVEVVPDETTLREMNMAGYPQSHAHVWVKATVTDIYTDDADNVRWIDVAIPVAPAGNYGGHVVVSGNNAPTLIRMTGVRSTAAALEGQTTRLFRA